MSFTKNFRHYLVLITIGYISGLIFARYTEPIFAFYSIIFSTVLNLVLIIKIIFNLFKFRIFKKPSVLMLIFLIPFILGYTNHFFWNNKGLYQFSLLEYDYAGYVARINSYPEEISYNTLVSDATIYKIINNSEVEDANINIRLFLKSTDMEPVSLGDTIKFYTKYIPQDNEYTIYQKGKNQIASLSTSRYLKTDEYPVPPYAYNIFSDFGQKIRAYILNSIDKVYGYNLESAAIVKAILTGHKNDLSDNLYNAFADAGFLHVAAISGTHVSILFTFLSFFLFTLRINKKLTTLITAIIIMVFSSVAAFTPSVIRASIMLILSMFAMYLNREYDPLTALFFSALVILIKYPYALYTSGFLLSFGAALGIIIYYRYFSKIFKKLFGKFTTVLFTDSIAVSISAFLGTAPFTLFFFKSLSLWSLITNIWIVPMVLVIFCLGILSSITYYIYPPIAFDIIRYLNEPFILFMIKTAKTFSSFKIGIYSPAFVPWCIYLYYIVFIFLLYYYLKKGIKKISETDNIFFT